MNQKEAMYLVHKVPLNPREVRLTYASKPLEPGDPVSLAVGNNRLDFRVCEDSPFAVELLACSDEFNQDQICVFFPEKLGLDDGLRTKQQLIDYVGQKIQLGFGEEVTMLKLDPAFETDDSGPGYFQSMAIMVLASRPEVGRVYGPFELEGE